MFLSNRRWMIGFHPFLEWTCHILPRMKFRILPMDCIQYLVLYEVQVGRIELPSRGPKPRGLPFSYTRVRMLGLEPRSRAPKARRLATDLHPDDPLEGSVLLE